MLEPRELAARIEAERRLPDGDEERFSGYGVMGVPFRSGHLLCLRRFPAASIGKGYTSVWHRSPGGCWTFIQDVPPRNGCTRYFGSAVDRTVESPIHLEWTGPRSLQVRTEGAMPVEWTFSLARTRSSDLMNRVSNRIPDRMWRSRTLLRAMSAIGGIALGAGRLNLTGVLPNGQRFMANPKVVWTIDDSRATVCGEDIGPTGPLAEQARLGDLWLPQEGRFFAGNAFLEKLDTLRHLTATSRPDGKRRHCLVCP
ncbi:MAG: hypothetical protein ACOWWM_09190 [Desulfobacterales bacterium]